MPHTPVPPLYPQAQDIHGRKRQKPHQLEYLRLLPALMPESWVCSPLSCPLPPVCHSGHPIPGIIPLTLLYALQRMFARLDTGVPPDPAVQMYNCTVCNVIQVLFPWLVWVHFSVTGSNPGCCSPSQASAFVQVCLKFCWFTVLQLFDVKKSCDAYVQTRVLFLSNSQVPTLWACFSCLHRFCLCTPSTPAQAAQATPPTYTVGAWLNADACSCGLG